jgi:fructokinase
MKDIIVGIGEILWDMLPEGKVLGGAPANFAYHASQLGFNGCAISAIGKDANGDGIIDILSEKQLNYILEIVDYPTGTVEVELDDQGIPQYKIRENVAWDNIPWTSQIEKLVLSTKAVCFGSLAQRSNLSRNTINHFLDVVPTDSIKVFDINLRQHFYSKKIVEDSLKKCNIFKLNDEEVVVLAKLFDWKNMSELGICERLIEEYNLKVLILTKGVKGSYVLTSQEKLFRETPKVKVVDTVGAGDSFTASFISAFLRGKSLQDAHGLAVEVSAYVCTQPGAMPKLPNSLLNLLEK